MTEPAVAAGAPGTRLPAHDAALLELETPEVPMHAGALFILEAPSDPADRARGYARFVAHVRARLHRVPRYRQRLVTPPFGLGTPVWTDDTEFDLSYHVRHAALPRPGSIQQLTEYAARILSRPLDRGRPLWELYVIEGLEDDRWAILTKSHVALIDGLDGMDLVSVLFDTDREPRREPPPPWTPARTPNDVELARDAVAHLVTSPSAALQTGRRLVDTPRKTLVRAADVGRGVLDLARANVLRRAPRSLLNTRPGRSRRLGVAELPLEDVKQVKNTFGTTVTDVVLAIVADATGRYLRSRDVRTDGQWLRVLVPVATREDGDDHALGNGVVSVLVDLPMAEMDPVERLRVCQQGMAEVKVSHRAVGAGFLTELGGFAPATFHAMASRVATRGRLYNFLVTNVPGPQQPVYCLGTELVGAHPFPPLTAAHSYAVGVISTAGSLHVGLTGDYDAVPDIDRLGGYLAAALRELTVCAGAAGTRAELTRPTHARDGG